MMRLRSPRSAAAPILAAVAAMAAAPSAGAQLRVVTYNVAQLQGNGAALDDVVAALVADDKPGFAVAPAIYVFQEVQQADLGPLTVAVSLAAPGVPYAAATYTNFNEDPVAGAQALFYRTDLLSEDAAGHADIFTGAGRYADRWALSVAGSDDPAATLYVYSAHLKAGTGIDDEDQRLFGAMALRDDAATLPPDAHLVYAGDFNLKSSAEPAYAELTAPGIGRGIDPLGGGTWSGPANALKHSQSPLASSSNGLTGGGMDDRFDFQLSTAELHDGAGLAIIPGTYRVLGNDGGHYDQAINAGQNTYYPDDPARSNALADDLHAASDHLPVVVEYQLPAAMLATLAPSDAGRVIQGAAVDLQLSVLNVAPAVVPQGADALTYVALGAGAATGSAQGSVAAASPAEISLFALDTDAVGDASGTVTAVAQSEAAQNPLQVLSVTASVLRAADPSFDDATDLDATTVIRSVEADGGLHLIEVPVHNLAFDAAVQALLDVDGAGPLTAPFALAGGLPTGIGAEPATLAFSFDTGGAAPGTYAIDVPIATSDEDLPGETAHELLLTLEITVGGAVCAGDVDGDGAVTVSDMLALLGAWGECPGCPEDLDGDGTVGVEDLLTLLGGWGPCE